MNRLDKICTQELSLRELLRNHNRIAFCYHIFHNSDGQKTPMNFNLSGVLGRDLFFFFVITPVNTFAHSFHRRRKIPALPGPPKAF